MSSAARSRPLCFTPVWIWALILSALLSCAAKAGAESSTSNKTSPVLLDVDAALGLFIRLNDHPYMDMRGRSGLSAGGGFFFAPLSSFALGFHYEHANAGSDAFAGEGPNSLRVLRGMHTLFLDARVHPLRRPSYALTFDLGLGLGWQYASAAGTADFGGLGRDVRIFLCDAKDTKSLGFRAGLGTEIPLRGGLFATAQASVTTMRFSGELINNCAPGAGTTAALTLRAGLMYRFDLSEVFVNR